MQIGSLFTTPITPKVYLHISPVRDIKVTYHSSQEEPNEAPNSVDSYFMMLMEDIPWGVTQGAFSGVTLDNMLAVVDDLAEFQAYFMTSGNKVLQRLVSEGTVLRPKAHMLYSATRTAMNQFSRRLPYYGDEKVATKLKPFVEWFDANFEEYWADFHSQD